jgi:hypothetical protein
MKKSDSLSVDDLSAELEHQRLSEDELGNEAGSLLPDREAMSLIMPGATADTAAADLVPTEAQQWHGNPNEPHIM